MDTSHFLSVHSPFDRLASETCRASKRRKRQPEKSFSNVDHSAPFSGIQELPKNFLFSDAVAVKIDRNKKKDREIV